MATENDIVLVYMEDKPIFFARIESIHADVKKDWYHVKLLFLQIPLHVASWLLRDIYIDGETFTMDGRKMRLERIVCPQDPDKPKPKPKTKQNAKIISFADLKKNKS